MKTINLARGITVEMSTGPVELAPGLNNVTEAVAHHWYVLANTVAARDADKTARIDTSCHHAASAELAEMTDKTTARYLAKRPDAWRDVARAEARRTSPRAGVLSAVATARRKMRGDR